MGTTRPIGTFERLALLVRGPGSTRQEREFCLEWKKRSAVVYGVAAIYMMCAFHLGALALDGIDAARGAAIGPSWIVSLGSLMLLTAWRFYQPDEKHLIVYLLLFSLTLISLAYRIHVFHQQTFYDGHLPIAAHIGFTLMATACISMMPTVGVVLPVFLSAVGFAILHTAWLPYGDAWPALRLSMIVMSSGLVFHFVLGLKSTREARREFHARALLDTFEKARLEQDLLLARRIQDSLSSFNRQDFAPFSTGILHQRFSQVGGDWAALRQDQKGAVYVLVADAAGKGIQAALVLHSVQALWAESLGQPNFDPAEWLRRVNAALCQLGAKKPHMLTLGIAKFSHTSCSYFSAGHLPLFLVSRDASTDQDDVKILLAPGTPVGLIQEITVGHAKVDCGPDFIAFLGSDGFFQTGSHQKRKAILNLKDRLLAGETLLQEEGQSDDDQTLIWVSRGSAFKRA